MSPRSGVAVTDARRSRDPPVTGARRGKTIDAFGGRTVLSLAKREARWRNHDRDGQRHAAAGRPRGGDDAARAASRPRNLDEESGGGTPARDRRVARAPPERRRAAPSPARASPGRHRVHPGGPARGGPDARL